MKKIDFNQKKGFICDMDGVIYHGNQILPGVVEFVNWLQRENKEFLFLTSNSSYTPRELQHKLARMGLDVSEDHFYTSAQSTASFLSSQSPGCSAYVIGEAGLLNALYDKGICTNDVNPEYVVVGETRTYNFEKIEKAIEKGNLYASYREGSSSRNESCNIVPDESGNFEAYLPPIDRTYTFYLSPTMSSKSNLVGSSYYYVSASSSVFSSSSARGSNHS